MMTSQRFDANSFLCLPHESEGQDTESLCRDILKDYPLGRVHRCGGEVMGEVAYNHPLLMLLIGLFHSL